MMTKGKVDVNKVKRRRQEVAEEQEAASTPPASHAPPPGVILLDTSKECQVALIAELDRIKDELTAVDYSQDQVHDQIKAVGARLTANYIRTQEKLAEWKVRASVEADEGIIEMRSSHTQLTRDLKRLRMEWDITLQKINLVSRLHNRELTEMNLTGGK
jgi:hypothetical protein